MLVRLIRGKSCQRPLHVGQDFPRGVLGRHIVLAPGLLKLAKASEEAAGALAHEMSHG